MKKTILTALVLMTTSISFGQSKVNHENTKKLALKTISEYQLLLKSEELKTCWRQDEFKRLFTNSCTEFLALTESSLDKLAETLDLHAPSSSRFLKQETIDHLTENVEEVRLHLQSNRIRSLSSAVRESKAFTIERAVEAMQTGDAKEQVDVVVQRLREEIKEIQKYYL